MSEAWADFGVDLHLDLDTAGPRRAAALERALREAIRSGRLAPGVRLPSTRALAVELNLARNTVAAAYEQLAAEGYLTARTGSGTTVADIPYPPAPARAAAAPTAPPPDGQLRQGAAAEPLRHPRGTVPEPVSRLDLRPGSPDVGTFPVDAWIRATRRALAHAPVSAYDYGDPRGRVELRTALAGYLGRVRGVVADPERIVICSGYVQALALLARVVGGPVAMEDPGLPFHREVVAHTGAGVLALPVDEHGARTDLLVEAAGGPRDTSGPNSEAAGALPGARAVVLTPAHQYPTGVTLHPDRRHAAVAWARDTGGVVIEDDYDGEFRYDRQPVGALQGMAPDHVAYVGTAAKTLGPAVRLAWMVLPERLVEPVAHAKRLTDLHTESIGQLALAELITSHGYDRHIRACRLHYRRRRDLLIDRIGRRHALRGVAAGLHALLDLTGTGADEGELVGRAAARGLALSPLGPHWHSPGRAGGRQDVARRAGGRQDVLPRAGGWQGGASGLIIGYATPGQASYPAALDMLARVLRAG